jgi:hypothetical protein
MRIMDAFQIGPSSSLGNKRLLDIGRTEKFLIKFFLKLCGYSNPLCLRHTLASQKMRTQAWGQRALWTPYLANTPNGGVE